MGLLLGRKRVLAFNRHHMLYPARAWRDAGPSAQYLRGMFIIHLPMNLHKQLHDKIDKKLGEEINPNLLPARLNLQRIANVIQVNEANFEKYTPLKKLAWLQKNIECVPHSKYLDTLLKKQISFLRKHEGEY